MGRPQHPDDWHARTQPEYLNFARNRHPDLEIFDELADATPDRSGRILNHRMTPARNLRGGREAGTRSQGFRIIGVAELDRYIVNEKQLTPDDHPILVPQLEAHAHVSRRIDRRHLQESLFPALALSFNLGEKIRLAGASPQPVVLGRVEQANTWLGSDERSAALLADS
jgi:hypothetical protein